MSVRLARLVASLVISGLALLVVGIVLSFTPARAANSAAARDYGRNYDTSTYRYTDKPALLPLPPAAARSPSMSTAISIPPSASASGWRCSNGTTC